MSGGLNGYGGFLFLFENPPENDRHRHKCRNFNENFRRVHFNASP